MGLPAPYYDDGQIVIYHADCFDILHHLSGVDAVISDPPYSSGGQFRGDRMAKTVEKYVHSGVQAQRFEFTGDNRDQRSYLAWVSLWMNAALRASNIGATMALFTDWRQLPITTDAVQAAGWVWRGIGVWDKTPAARPRLGGITAQSEYVVWGSYGPLNAERNPVTLPGVFSERSPFGDAKMHIAEKPYSVMRWLVQLCPPGGLVLDPFMGSGTTLRAAKDLGRRAIGIEIEERYCEIAVKRLAQQALPLTELSHPPSQAV